MRHIEPMVFVAICLLCAPVPGAEPTADDYLKFFKPIIGEWDVTFRSEGQTSKGQLTLTLAPTNRCIIESARGFGPIPAFDGVSGFDPETKSWKSLFFNSEGERVTRYCYTPKLEGSEASFRVRFLIAGTDGKVAEETAAWRIKISANRYELHATEVTSGGEKQPDLNAVFERK